MSEIQIEVGDTFYRKDYKRNPYKHHIVAILKDENETQVVYKYFGKHKRWWHYEIMSLTNFEYGFEIGLYSYEIPENI